MNSHIATEYGSLSDFNNNDDQIILSMNVKGRKFGCSILNCSAQTLKTLDQDFQLSIATNYTTNENGIVNVEKFADEINIMGELLILENNPTVCLLSSRMEEACFKYIEGICDSIGCKIELQSSDVYKKLSLIKELKWDLLEGSNYLVDLFRNIDDINNSITISTIVSIINHINCITDIDETEDITASVIRGRNLGIQNAIKYITLLSFKDKMFLDSETISSLHILPDIQYGEDRLIQNGSFSIFELLNKTSSILAKNILTNWLLFPLTKLEDIKSRSDIVKLFNEQNNHLLFEDLRSKIKNCPNAYSFINTLRNGRATYQTWLQLVNFLKLGIDIFYVLSSFSLEEVSPNNIINSIKSNVDISLFKRVLKKIESVIDVEETKETKSIWLNKGLDADLDDYKAIFQNIEFILGDIAINEEESIIKRLNTLELDRLDIKKRNFLNIVYIPQMGYMASIDKSYESIFNVLEYLKWEEVFETITSKYFKTETTIKLDETYGDIYAFISDIEVEILQELQIHVLDLQTSMLFYNRALAELDVLCSFALVSQTRNYVEPTLVDNECIIEIENGRNPLYETIVQLYIPNSLSLEGGLLGNEVWNKQERNKRIVVLTGANGSGKTVFLNQIGIVVYLAHIGCFVPADSAVIGIVDRILTRINSKESMILNKSSFENDAKQMSKCISLSSEKSLLLIDEFGKGTDTVDGPALFGAIIQYLSRKATCPRVITCTHFFELFRDDVLSTTLPGTQFCKMDLLINSDLEQDVSRDPLNSQMEENIVFLYKVVPGLSINSFGIHCAKLCNMKREIISRAYELNKIISNGEDIVANCSKLTNNEIKVFEESQTMVKAFLTWDIDLESNTAQDDLKKKLKAIIEGKQMHNTPTLNFDGL